jgi:hypothetical protein
MFRIDRFFLCAAVACLVVSVSAGVCADEAGAARLLSRTSVFPVGVWLQKPELAGRYKELGVNLYVGLWKGPTSAQLALLKKAGMPVICEQNDVGLLHAGSELIVGWQQEDEPDNAKTASGLAGRLRIGPKSPRDPEEMKARYREIRRRDPGRPVFMNLGKGVAYDGWKGRGARTAHLEDYPEYVQAADIISFDIYPAADQTPGIGGRLELVAKGVERLRKWAGPDKAVWSFIGASRVNNEDAKILGAQVRAQVWMAITKGARGIVYFVHQFSPTFADASLLENSSLAAQIREINSQLHRLAPIINSPATTDISDVNTYVRNGKRPPENDRLVSLSSRRFGCSIYIFAVSLTPNPLSIALSLADLGREQNVEVLDEDRSIAISNGVFRDSFEGYGVHLYKTSARACRPVESAV